MFIVIGIESHPLCGGGGSHWRCVNMCLSVWLPFHKHILVQIGGFFQRKVSNLYEFGVVWAQQKSGKTKSRTHTQNKNSKTMYAKLGGFYKIGKWWVVNGAKICTERIKFQSLATHLHNRKIKMGMLYLKLRLYVQLSDCISQVHFIFRPYLM